MLGKPDGSIDGCLLGIDDGWHVGTLDG